MIDINNVSKWYGNFQVLTDCSTQIRKGEVVGYVGRTGDARGAHLHLGIASLLGDTQHWWQAKQLNPYTLLRHAFGFECDTLNGGRTTCAEDATGADTTR